MTPVAKTGLHCGECHEPGGAHLRRLVTPVAKTGLHCGNDEVINGDTAVDA